MSIKSNEYVHNKETHGVNRNKPAAMSEKHQSGFPHSINFSTNHKIARLIFYIKKKINSNGVIVPVHLQFSITSHKFD